MAGRTHRGAAGCLCEALSASPEPRTLSSDARQRPTNPDKVSGFVDQLDEHDLPAIDLCHLQVSGACLAMPLLSNRGDAPEPGHDDRSGDGQRQHDPGCDTAASALVAKQAALAGPMGRSLAHGSRCPSRIESMWPTIRPRTCSVTSRAFSSRSTRPRAIAHTNWLSQNTPADQISLSLVTLKCLSLSSLSGAWFESGFHFRARRCRRSTRMTILAGLATCSRLAISS